MISWSYETPNLDGPFPSSEPQGFQLEADGPWLLDFTQAGEVVVHKGIDGIIENIRASLQFILGEWFLDRREGFPLFQAVLVTNPDLGVIEQVIRMTIESVPGVIAILDIKLDFLREQRKLITTWAARAENGIIITARDEPFIIGAASGGTE